MRTGHSRLLACRLAPCAIFLFLGFGVVFFSAAEETHEEEERGG